MKDKILFEDTNIEGLFERLKAEGKKKIFNFLNQHDLYQFAKEPTFKKALAGKGNVNLIDGVTIALYLTIKNMKKVRRTSGPVFTREFFSEKELSGGMSHFFLGFEDDDLKKIKKRFSHLKKAESYNPPYIKGMKFDQKEIEKIAEKINKAKADIVWVGIGCPKQNILSSELYEMVDAKYFMNVGAALDFVLGKKKEAPRFVKKTGVEWLYRLFTDFEHSKKKVVRSFLALKYLKYAGLNK